MDVFLMALLPLPLSSIVDPALRDVIAGLLAQQGPGATAVAGQLPGTTTNDNASAGNVGQYISSNIPLASAITLVLSATPYNITSISLTAGDWDVFATAHLGSPGTSTMSWWAGISATSATIPTLSDTISGTDGPVVEINDTAGLPNAQVLFLAGRALLAAPATIYLIGYEVYTGTAPIAYGYISARRAR